LPAPRKSTRTAEAEADLEHAYMVAVFDNLYKYHIELHSGYSQITEERLAIIAGGTYWYDIQAYSVLIQ
jgi:hypothetical protein